MAKKCASSRGAILTSIHLRTRSSSSIAKPPKTISDEGAWREQHYWERHVSYGRSLRDTARHSLNSSGISTFAKSLIGELVLPRDRNYRRSRRVSNHAVNKYPAIIVRCANPKDVSASS